MKNSSKTPAYWRDQLAQFESSGCSQSEYCKQNGYTSAALSYWRRKFSEEIPSRPSFVPVEVRDQESNSETVLKITLPNGVCLDYFGAIDEALIKSLAAVGG